MTIVENIYIAIDLKSFYASVECVERGLDPLTTNLLVADNSRTNKTICLAVSPSLKALGLGGRPRLFEAEQCVRAINAERLQRAPHRKLTGESTDAAALARDASLAVAYITASPQMALYIDYSTRVYGVYLRHIAPEDIHVYSVDEVFIDATAYLKANGLSPQAFARLILRDVWEETGITATAGIGTNLYLAKVAMDILAKKSPADAYGARIATLTERTYREQLWDHRPLTDFWRIGHGYAKKLAQYRMFTMGDVALCSLRNEWLLYKLFGVNAELLIDHAWGWEPCTIADIKAYKPLFHSTSVGQVLTCPYETDKARLIVQEMTDQLALDLTEKRLTTDQLVLYIGYDRENLADPERRAYYTGAVTVDHYGRAVPKHAHGTVNLGCHTSSGTRLLAAMTALFDRTVERGLLCRRINLTANHLLDEASARQNGQQLSLFDTGDAEKEEREHRLQEAILAVRRKYGKNAVLKGMNLEDGATARDRNRQIGGHKA
ncbi:MAG: DNA methylase [Ruminococcaceae bacterium]|nr:DNA methylase [Oscillospiraceae bacterium]